MKKTFTALIIISFVITPAFADRYVPEFDKMQVMHCEIDEQMFDSQDKLISQTSYHRVFRMDDENKRLYIQKEPVDNISLYSSSKIEFKMQNMSDDYIEASNVSIDRNENTYTASMTKIYDNIDFGTKKAKASGNCKILK